MQPDWIPASCLRCPHYDRFSKTCSHDSRQAILYDLTAGDDECPVYERVRADAMRELAASLESGPDV